VSTGRDELDLGDGHRLVFSEYKGEARVGANVLHPPVEGKCDGQGWIAFEDTSWSRLFATNPIATWKVETREPFTISPSILCRACGDHGFIRDGKWVRA
jgi:hypothetical protein